MDNALTPMNLLTKVRVLRGVPFDSNYRNVCDGYSNADNQYTVISTGRVKYSFDAISPIRHQNVIRLPVCADYLYDCNYICWQNANFNNKWFYAFITKVDWININMCFVHYQIDIWNTWYFDGTTSNRTARGWSMERCFVEREHTNNDTVGSNIVPEGLETGEYVWNGYPTMTHFSKTGAGTSNLRPAFLTTMKITWNSPTSVTFDDFTGWGYEFIFGGLNVYVCNDYDEAESIIYEASRQNKTDGLKAMFMCPNQFYDASRPNHFNRYGTYSNYLEMSRPTTIKGYGIPRNKKLLTYPYSFIHISNNQGNSANYLYEYFNDPTEIHLSTIGTAINGAPEFILYPSMYKGDLGNLEEKLSLSDFPACSWSSNAFWDWFAQNRANVAMGLISNAIGMAGGIQNSVTPASPNYLTQMAGTFGAMNNAGALTESAPLVNPANVQSSINPNALQSAVNIGGILANTYIKTTQPPNAHGVGDTDVRSAFGFTDFIVGHKTIKPEFAEIIDSYFDRFGYATHITKIPNLRGRAQWNYVKTVECSIQPLKMSLEDATSIEDMFDRGITIWHNINNIGNYSLSNPIV